MNRKRTPWLPIAAGIALVGSALPGTAWAEHSLAELPGVLGQALVLTLVISAHEWIGWLLALCAFVWVGAAMRRRSSATDDGPTGDAWYITLTKVGLGALTAVTLLILLGGWLGRVDYAGAMAHRDKLRQEAAQVQASSEAARNLHGTPAQRAAAMQTWTKYSPNHRPWPRTGSDYLSDMPFEPPVGGEWVGVDNGAATTAAYVKLCRAQEPSCPGLRHLFLLRGSFMEVAGLPEGAYVLRWIDVEKDRAYETDTITLSATNRKSRRVRLGDPDANPAVHAIALKDF